MHNLRFGSSQNQGLLAHVSEKVRGCWLQAQLDPETSKLLEIFFLCFFLIFLCVCVSFIFF